MSQTFNVPKITNGPATADTLNVPLNYIEDALNQLQSDAVNTQQALLQYQVPVGASVTAGDLVFYNTSTSCYQKAFTDTFSNSQGQLMQAASCHVQGLILSKSATENSAVMLRGGYFEDSVITSAIGVGAQPGTYYLSSTPGKATLTPGWSVRIPVISYYGDGKFSMLSTGVSHVGHPDASIKNIESTTLTVTKTGDTVEIQQSPYTLQTPQFKPYAITGISNGQLAVTPVASAVKGGAGIQVSFDSETGKYTVSQDSLINKPLPASDFTLNGVQRVADNLLTYSVFPQGTQASMTMVLPVNFSQTTSFTGKVQIWLTAKGPGSGTFNAELYWLPYNKSFAQQHINLGTLQMVDGNTSNTALLYAQSSTGIDVQLDTSGVIIARLTPSSAPNQSIYVYQAGFKFALEVVSDSLSTTPIDQDIILAVMQKYLSFNPA